MTGASTLFAAWSDPARNLAMPVGRLARRRGSTGDAYEFCYIRGAVAAQERGFLPFLAFPDLHALYRSRKLFPFFANRLMPATRPDHAEYLGFLGLSSQERDDLTILGRAGGRRETDRVELLPVPSRNEKTGEYSSDFWVRGLRYFPGAESRIVTLSPGEQLLCMLDIQNEVNPSSVALRTNDRCLIGYLPDYLVTDIVQLAMHRAPMVAHVERVNPRTVPAHYRLLCRVTAAWPPGFAPLSGDSFLPLAERPAQSGLPDPEATTDRY